MRSRHRSTTEDVITLFRDNIVDVDSVDESASLVRKTLILMAVALLTTAGVNFFIALFYSQH